MKINEVLEKNNQAPVERFDKAILILQQADVLDSIVGTLGAKLNTYDTQAQMEDEAAIDAFQLNELECKLNKSQFIPPEVPSTDEAIIDNFEFDSSDDELENDNNNNNDNRNFSQTLRKFTF